MVPNITAEGTSFYGAFLYYFHDKQARTRERIGFTQTLNMLTDCVDKAWKVMAYTAKNAAQLKKASGQVATGAKLKKSVFAYSLAWHPEQAPTKEDMLQAAKESLAALGLSEHEAMIAEHLDEPQPHLHIVVNKVHPLTGLVAKLKYTKDKLSDFAHKLERKEGKMYCPKREENHAKREAGQQTKYVDPVISKAWSESQNGRGFQSELERSGYQLAQGRKRLVVVTAQGKAVNPIRELEGVRAKDFKDRMRDLKAEDLLTVEEAVAKLQKAKDVDGEIGNARGDSIAELKAGHLNEQQSSQHEERSRLTSTHTREMSLKQGELMEFYRLEKKHSEISKLQRQIDRAGFFQKIIGLNRMREHKLERLEAGCRNAEMRFNEAITTLSNKHSVELSELDSRHQAARVELKQSLEKWWPQPSIKDSANTSHQKYSRGHDDDRPGLER